MPVIEIKNGHAKCKLLGVDRTTISRFESLIRDLSHPGSPVAEQAEAVKKPLGQLLLALSFPSTEGTTDDQEDEG